MIILLLVISFQPHKLLTVISSVNSTLWLFHFKCFSLLKLPHLSLGGSGGSGSPIFFKKIYISVGKNIFYLYISATGDFFDIIQSIPHGFQFLLLALLSLAVRTQDTKQSTDSHGKGKCGIFLDLTLFWHPLIVF